MKLFIANANIVSENEVLPDCSLLSENGQIVDFGKIKAPSDAKIIDAKGALLLPAFVDIHTHGCLNCDFSDGDIFGFEKIAEQKLKEGVAAILPTSLTLPEQKIAQFLRTCAEYSKNEKFCEFLGAHLEGPFINKEFAGSQNPEFTRPCDISEIDRLSRIYKIAKVSYSIEQDKQNGLFAAELIKRNIVPSCAHSNATFTDFAKAHSFGLKNITHFFDRCSPFTHRQPGVVGAGLYFNDTYLEVIADFKHVCKDALKILLKLKDNNKIIFISDSIRAQAMPDGDYVMGGIPITLKDNAAIVKGKGVFAGSVLSLNEAFKNAAIGLGMGVVAASKCLSYNPLKSLGIENCGLIKKGFKANLALLDENCNVLLTAVGGVVKYQRI